MSMDVMSSSGRDESDEQRARQRRVAEERKSSGALEGIFAQVDAGAPLTGPDGVLSGVVEAALERVSNPGRFTLLIWPLINMEVADCLCSHDVVF